MIESPFVYDDFSTNDSMNIAKKQREKYDENTTIFNQLASMLNLKTRHNNVTLKKMQPRAHGRCNANFSEQCDEKL